MGRQGPQCPALFHLKVDIRPALGETAWWKEVQLQCFTINSRITPYHSFIFICWFGYTYSLVQFSHSVVFNSSQPHGLQHTRPPCPSPTPRIYSNSCLLSQWCHPTISSSFVPFNLSQHRGLFKWDSSSHQVAKVLHTGLPDSAGRMSYFMCSL